MFNTNIDLRKHWLAITMFLGAGVIQAIIEEGYFSNIQTQTYVGIFSYLLGTIGVVLLIRKLKN